MGNLHQNQQTNNHGQSGPTISDKPGYRFTFIEKSTKQIPHRHFSNKVARHPIKYRLLSLKSTLFFDFELVLDSKKHFLSCLLIIPVLVIKYTILFNNTKKISAAPCTYFFSGKAVSSNVS